MNICLKKADPAKKEILFRLLQYSLFEESLHDQNSINEDALFDYPWFDLYFTEKDRDAFFIHEQDNQPSAWICNDQYLPAKIPHRTQHCRIYDPPFFPQESRRQKGCLPVF